MTPKPHALGAALGPPVVLHTGLDCLPNLHCFTYTGCWKQESQAPPLPCPNTALIRAVADEDAIPFSGSCEDQLGRVEFEEREWESHRRQAGQRKRGGAGAVVLGASFPRSGSTWLYRTLESVTGVVGCSVYNETWAPGHSGGAFLPSDSVFTVKRASGEAPGPLTPCLTKTHFPFVGTALDATVRAAGLLVLVRNPVDAVSGMFRYLVRKAGSRPDHRLAVFGFASLLRSYFAWVQTWMEVADALQGAGEGSPTVPVLVVRYEDLCMHPNDVFPMVMSFLGAEEAHDTQRILAAAVNGTCGERFIGRNVRYLTRSQVEEVVSLTKSNAAMNRLGYGRLLTHLASQRDALGSREPWPEMASFGWPNKEPMLLGKGEWGAGPDSPGGVDLGRTWWAQAQAQASVGGSAAAPAGARTGVKEGGAKSQAQAPGQGQQEAEERLREEVLEYRMQQLQSALKDLREAGGAKAPGNLPGSVGQAGAGGLPGLYPHLRPKRLQS